jgi:hypothetical protein
MHTPQQSTQKQHAGGYERALPNLTLDAFHASINKNDAP